MECQFVLCYAYDRESERKDEHEHILQSFMMYNVNVLMITCFYSTILS